VGASKILGGLWVCLTGADASTAAIGTLWCDLCGGCDDVVMAAARSGRGQT